MMNVRLHKVVYACVAVLCSLVLTPQVLSSYVMGSTNYRIDVDSVNSGGLDVSTSTNYGLIDTVGEIATGFSSSTNFNIYAGYRQMLSAEATISISDAANVNLGSINGLTGGSATGQSEWLVTTDSPSGYSLSIKASTNPALKSSISSFADYTPAGSDPDYSFSIATTASEFGYSPEGSDIIGRYKDNGTICNAGTSDASDKCWDAFSTTDNQISASGSSNYPTGATTTVKYRAQVGTSKIQDSGSDYSATITVTAITL